jgi:8-oxo-dGTP diphosphatase
MLIRAAGAVTWRPGPDGDEVLLVHRAKYDDWSLPKGKHEPGESLPQTAAREVREETGARVILGRHLAPVRYKAGGHPKQVDYWVARPAAVDDGAVPNHEVDEVAWLTVPRALERVTYKQDVAVLIDFTSGPGTTVPLILLRHAKTLSRSDWKRADADRPLDKAGAADAATLGGLLACFAPRATVASSATVRCLDTVAPYAAATGSAVQALEDLAAPSRARPAPRPDPAAVLGPLIEAREPAIVCAHRENLPALLESAVRLLDGKPPRDKDAAPLPKGAFLILHCVGGQLTAVDRYDSFAD